MNLETAIDERLWKFISANYDKRNYTGAILDSIYFLSDIIREKSGLENDGVALVGQAFGGKTPKIKVTKLQTESDWNTQQGIEQILRGVFQAFRNPRSHGKYEDSQVDAISIIVFINHLLRIIDNAKTRFSIDQIILRVHDEDFVDSDEYATLIIDEIPVQKRLDTLIQIFKAENSKSNVKNLKLFFKNMFQIITEAEREEFMKIVSEELKFTDDIKTVRMVAATMPQYWEEIEKTARLRSENKFIKAAAAATVSRKTNRYNEQGAFFTWVTNIADKFLLKDKLIDKLQDLIQSKDDDKIYFFEKTGFWILQKIQKEPDLFTETNIRIKLSAGDVRFYELIMNSRAEWKKVFEDDVNNFVEKSVEDPIDDLPF